MNWIFAIVKCFTLWILLALSLVLLDINMAKPIFFWLLSSGHIVLYSLMFYTFNTLATWWEELTHLKRPWCWEGLKAGGEGADRGWAGRMASQTQWTWVWVNSGSWWWTGRPGMLQSMGLQRVRHNWTTELNYWTDVLYPFFVYLL